MTERVIHCAGACATALQDRPHTSIASLAGGEVLAVPDATLLALLRLVHEVPILHYSRAALDAALAGLTEPEVEQVLDKRLAWSALAYDQIPDHLYRRERRCLAIAAERSATRGADTATLAAFIERTLALLADLTGSGRYDDVAVADLLVIALERESVLAAELRSLLPAGDPEAAAELQLRDRAISELGQLLARLGRPEYAAATLYLPPQRGLYIAPRDDGLVGSLMQQRQAHVEWREGLVTTWPSDRIASLHAGGKQTEVLYLDAGAFLTDLEEQAEPQLGRTFAAREQQLADPAAARDAVADHLTGLRLEQVLYLRHLHHQLGAQEPRLAGWLGNLADAETKRLLRGLAERGGSALDDTPTAAGTTDLRDCARAALADGTAFAAFAEASGRSELAQRLGQVAAAQRDKLALLGTAR